MDAGCHITALIDFSEFTEGILQMASWWHQLPGTQTELMHQVASHLPMMADAGHKRELHSAGQREADRKLQQFLLPYPELRQAATVIITHSSPLQFLHELPDAGESRLVVCGQGSTGLLKRILLGSTVTKIIEETSLPVLALPRTPVEAPPWQWVIAINPDVPLNLAQLNRLIGFARPYVASLSMVTVAANGDRQHKAEVKLQEYAVRLDAGKACETQVLPGTDAADTLTDYLAGRRDVLLVIQRGPRGIWDRLFREQVSQRLLDEGSLPLLILPPNESTA